MFLQCIVYLAVSTYAMAYNMSLSGSRVKKNTLLVVSDNLIGWSSSNAKVCNFNVITP